jgi:hypothetical protein
MRARLIGREAHMIASSSSLTSTMAEPGRDEGRDEGAVGGIEIGESPTTWAIDIFLAVSPASQVQNMATWKSKHNLW